MWLPTALRGAWPFVGAYKTLNAVSDLCDESGCVGLGTEFAHQALGWLVPFSLASVFAVCFAAS